MWYNFNDKEPELNRKIIVYIENPGFSYLSVYDELGGVTRGTHNHGIFTLQRYNALWTYEPKELLDKPIVPRYKKFRDSLF